MASISQLVDRVSIVAVSSGTGAFTLGPAVPAYRGIEALTDGATYSYATESGSLFETGTGLYLAASNTLVRTPQTSSNGGAAVAFPANVQIAFTALAQDIIATGASLPIVNTTGSDPNVAISQQAATNAINAITLGGAAWTLPDEANGDTIPAPGSKLPYLSGGVLKIA